MAEINRYNHSKIYKICSNLTDKYYIGSTTQTLAQRLSKHVGAYKTHIKNNTHYVSSYEIIKLGDAFIVLLEQCNFNNQQQLFKREGDVIKLNINNVVNKQITGRTQKEYFIDNKEQIIEYNKQFYIDNAEQLKIKQKQYRNDNAEHIAEYNKQTFTCNCGSITRFSDKSQHNKTKKHINFSYINELTFYNL